MDSSNTKNQFTPKKPIENLPADYKKSFFVYIDLLKCIGIDIFGPKLGRTNIYLTVRLFIFNILFIPFTCQQFCSIFDIKAENFQEGASVIPITLMMVFAAIKMTIALMKRDEICGIFMGIGELWPRELDDDEKGRMMRAWLKRMGFLIKAFFIYSVVSLGSFEAIPFLTTCYSIFAGVNEYTLPFPTPGHWDVNSTAVFVVTYAFQVGASGPSYICLYLPVDLLIVTITSNLSILLRILQLDLQNSIKAPHGLERENSSESFAEIRRIVIVHQKILRIIAKLNSIFGLVIFIHVAFAAILICIFGFLTVVFFGGPETITNLISMLNIVITIFLLAFFGQLLCDTSSGIADTAYNSLWYESDLKVRRLVLSIIIRSQQPSYLSALGYSNMSLQSFSKIMSSSWTYFSLLIQLYQEK